MLTLIMPYYDNAGMLRLQYEGWAAWPMKRKARLRVILVDDGSPEPAADVPRPTGLPELEIYRVTEDRPWHQHAARNLGTHVAPEGWLLLTDMDHVLTDDSARALLKRIDAGDLDETTAYMLDRVEADTGLPTLNGDGNPKPHPNSFVMTRETFWRVGGYDERLTGFYGTDAYFRRRLFDRAGRGHLDVPLVRYWRDLVPDASTRTLPRKEGRNTPERERKIAAAAAAPDDLLTLAFPWERVL
jgi:hypothetical protein